MYYVRGSELNDFLRCRLRWKYAWVDGLKSKKANGKLAFGTLFHKFLEVWYSTGRDSEKATRAMIELYNKENYFDRMDQIEINEMEEMLEQVTGNYIDTYKQQDKEYEVIATELTFAIPLDDEIGYTGTIDLIVRDKKDGRIWFLDHKTTSSIDKYDKASDMDRQISRYWWALQQLARGKGMILVDDEWVHVKTLDHSDVYYALHENEIGGFLYNIILKDYPVPPKVLKDGSLSKAKNQNTTYDLYCKALLDEGLADDAGGQIDAYPIEYAEILQHLQDNPKEYFRRVRVTRSQAEIDASIEELYATAIDMADQKLAVHYQDIHTKLNKPRIYRNITKDCPWDCAFMEVCRAGMDGSNVDFLVDTLFTKEEK